MKIRIVIATSNGLDFIILAVAMQAEKFCKEINKMRINDNYQDYRFTSSIKGRNNFAPKKREVATNREDDFKKELEESVNKKNKIRKKFSKTTS